MQIDGTLFPVQYAWEGLLIQSTGVFLGAGEKLPTASIGVPVWWNDKKLLGERWKPLASSNPRHGLARFSFSLRPHERQEVRRAEFAVYLHAQGDGPAPRFHGLFPYVDTPLGQLKIGISRELKFTSADTLKVATTIDLKQEVPVSTAEGIGESIAHWVLTPTPAHPLIGDQVMYALVELPPGVQSARATIHLIAEVEGRLGPIRSFLPKTEYTALGWILE